MKVKLTNEQVLQLMANAINASEPMGLGFLHAKPVNYTAEDISEHYTDDPFSEYRDINIDYYEGRMVKLAIRKGDDGFVDVIPDEPRVDYQSWARKYPTAEHLVNSVQEA